MKRINFRLFILPLLVLFCALIYYFGELVDWAAWNAIRHDFFYGIHDIHRLLFLAPIIYAAHHARIKGAVIVTLVSFVVFLPRAFFISEFPDPLLRMILFVIFAGAIGVLYGSLRNHEARSRRLELNLTRERQNLVKILDEISDGAAVIGPDYRIRLMNPRMVEDFGEGTGLTCYQHLRHLDAPCETACRVSNGDITRWQCRSCQGDDYEVFATPYVDSDGTACHLAVFRKAS